MRQSSARTLIKGTLIAILVSMIFNLSALPVGFGAPATQIAVVAPTSDIAVPTQFNVDITVIDVTELFSWGIKLYYNPAVLLWLNATLPPGHVFYGKPISTVAPFNGTDDGGTYILYQASLVGTDPPYPNFNGTGTLCRISFEAKAAGTSTLIFSRPLGGEGDTWLMSREDAPRGFPTIVFTAVDGSVNVVGSETRLPSAISCNIDKSAMFIQESAVISGSINVTVPDTQVTIKYWNYSNPLWANWLELVAVPTTASSYSYTWTPDLGETGIIGVRAEWPGNLNYKPATSVSKNISITVSPSWIRVQPTASTVGSQTVSLPTSPFAINVTIQDVIDMREWKIKLNYNQTILEALELSLPTYNVFGADYTLPEAVTIDNTSGFIQASARSSTASFNGSGVLCQVRFRGIGAPISETTFRYGTSNLEFDPGVTSLKDTPGAAITFNREQPAGTVRVETFTVQASTITLDIPSQVTIGNNVQISGRITPIGAGKSANVTITYRTDTMAERDLVTVKTDSNSMYSYTWNANATGTYTFKASWAGEERFSGANKETAVTVVEQQVENGGPNIMMYAIIAGVAAIVVIAVVLYFVKFRKGSQNPVP